MSLHSLFVFRSIRISLCFLVLILPAAGQRLAQGTKAEKTGVAGFTEAYCSSLSGNFRVCKALTSEQEDADFIIQRDKANVHRTEASAWKSIAASPDGFFAYRGDLDADGTAEIVIVSLDNVSQGMGVTNSTVLIFDGKTIGTAAQPVSFQIQEFGPGENFVYDPKEKRTDILISYWGEYSSIEPRRIPGVYLIGKWFRYNDGRLEPILSRPTLARRYLNSFARERDNGWFEGRTPHTWLKDRRTHKLYREPDEASQPISILNGTIKSFTTGETPAIQFDTGSGEILNGIFGSSSSDNTDIPAPVKITSVGIWEDRYTYPFSYSMGFDPAVFLSQIEGRRVRIEKYRTEYGREFAKVWLLDR